MSDLLDHLVAVSGHRFRDEALATQAFTHSSFANEWPGNVHNERLEFLGDAVVGLAAAQLLFDEEPNSPEGTLTQRRQRMVSTAGLAIVCEHLDLVRFLRLGGSVREKSRSTGTMEESICAGLVEALVGALTRELPLDTVLQVVRRWFTETRARITHLADPKPAKNQLQELLAQRPGHPAPEYRIVDKRGPDHDPWHRISVVVLGESIATGEGKRRKDAEEDAARLALAILRHRAASGG